MLFGIILSLFAAMSWGLAYVLEQKALLDFSVLKFLFYKSLLFLIVIIPIAFFSERAELKLSMSDWTILTRPFFLALIVINLTADFLILKSIQTVGASTAAIFEVIYPLFTVIFAFLILKESIHWLTAVGGIIIVFGSALVIYAGTL